MVLVTQNTMGGLGAGIQNLGSSLGQVLQQRGQKQQQEATRKQLASQFGSDTTLGKILSVPGSMEILQQLGPLLQPLLTMEAKNQGMAFDFRAEEGKDQETFRLPGYGNVSETQISRALKDPRENVRKWGEGAQKALVEEEEKKTTYRKYEGFIENIDNLREMLPYTGTTIVPGYKSFGAFGGKSAPNREALQKREEFDVLAFSLEGFLRELSSKGQLPKAIFEELMKKLPNSKLSEKQNMGRLDAIEKTIRRTSLPTAQDSSPIHMRDPSGKLRKVDRKDVKAAQKEGYKLER